MLCRNLFCRFIKTKLTTPSHCKALFRLHDTPAKTLTIGDSEVNIAGHAAGGLATYLSEKNYGHKRDGGQPYSLMAIPGLENYWGTGVFATEALTREAITPDKAKNIISCSTCICHIMPFIYP